MRELMGDKSSFVQPVLVFEEWCTRGEFFPGPHSTSCRKQISPAPVTPRCHSHLVNLTTSTSTFLLTRICRNGLGTTCIPWPPLNCVLSGPQLVNYTRRDAPSQPQSDGSMLRYQPHPSRRRPLLCGKNRKLRQLSRLRTGRESGRGARIRGHQP